MQTLEKKRRPIHVAYLWLRRFRKHYKKVFSEIDHMTNLTFVTRRELDIKMGAIRQRYCKYAERGVEMKHLWRCRIYHVNGPTFLLDRLIEGQCSYCRLTRKEKDVMFLGKMIKK
jgi:hypothetical protein